MYLITFDVIVKNSIIVNFKVFFSDTARKNKLLNNIRELNLDILAILCCYNTFAIFFMCDFHLKSRFIP